MQITLHQSLSEIDPKQWSGLTDADFPFADYAHLRSLESAGCVGEDAGWVPFYLCVRENPGEKSEILAANYFYIKNNSYGEFIFDHAWAQAYARSGVPYFPKAVSAVPFTPATGNKILVRSGQNRAQMEKILIEKTLEVAHSLKCSSVHFLFIPEHSVSSFENTNCLIRHSHQYHWHNHNYQNFSDFLNELKPKRRKQIALERRQLFELGLNISTVTGADLTPKHAQIMFELYKDTNDKMHSHACLNLEFFLQTFDSMRNSIVLFLAKKEEKVLAAAINYRKGKHMYGRYWGCSEDVRNLHFELCYYRAIDYAIENGIELYEAGAQGEHKIPRGFIPKITLSAHEIFHPQFKSAISSFLVQERSAVKDMMEDFSNHLPYLQPVDSKTQTEEVSNSHSIHVRPL